MTLTLTKRSCIALIHPLTTRNSRSALTSRFVYRHHKIHTSANASVFGFRFKWYTSFIGTLFVCVWMVSMPVVEWRNMAAQEFSRMISWLSVRSSPDEVVRHHSFVATKKKMTTKTEQNRWWLLQFLFTTTWMADGCCRWWTGNVLMHSWIIQKPFHN